LALAHVLTETQAHLAERGVTLRSAVAGTYITALDMTGFSITLSAAKPEWLDDWAAAHNTDLPRPSLAVAPDAEGSAVVERPQGEPSAWLDGFIRGLLALCDDLNALDQKAGDGDFGTNVRVGVDAARAWATGTDADLATDLRSLAQAFSNDVGGSSGPLLGLLFTHAANASERGDSLASGLRAGVEAITRVGGAQPGDRTLIDALHPAVFDGDADRASLDADAVQAAFDGAQSTAQMQGRRGRSSYLGDKVVGVPDPGALAAAWMVAALAEAESGDSHSQIRDQIAQAVRADR
jgi:dihydroxyacetone kinase